MLGLEIFYGHTVFFSILIAAHAMLSRSVAASALVAGFAKRAAAGSVAVATLSALCLAVVEHTIGSGFTGAAMAAVAATPVMANALAAMLLIIALSIYYSVQFSLDYQDSYLAYSVAIFIGGSTFVISSNVGVMFLGYELVLVPTTLMLEHFSKTSRSREATQFMTVWTQLGAILLFSSLLIIANIDSTRFNTELTAPHGRGLADALALLVFFGFAPKIPLWPFYWWLPEAHVEVPTSFSIVLSGVSVKFAFLGYVRFVELLGDNDLSWPLAVLSMVGLLDAAYKVESESDIKKIVAYQTVVEMHALVTYVSLDADAFYDFGVFAMVSHCWISAASFIVVDIISRRFQTRNIEKLYGIIGSAPVVAQLVFLVVFVYASIPGTLVFSLEFFLQIASGTSAFNVLLFAFMQLFVVVWSRSIWWTMWGGDKLRHELTFELTRRELALLSIVIIQSVPMVMFVAGWF